MRTLTIAAAILAATITSASASCGGEWTFNANAGDTHVGQDRFGYDITDRYGLRNNTETGTNNYSFGIQFKVPLGDDDCAYKRAQASKEREQARKAKAEAEYAERRAAKENEFAVSKRIDNLQRIIVTCESHSNLPICDKIDEMSMELFN